MEFDGTSDCIDLASIPKINSDADFGFYYIIVKGKLRKRLVYLIARFFRFVLFVPIELIRTSKD